MQSNVPVTSAMALQDTIPYTMVAPQRFILQYADTPISLHPTRSAITYFPDGQFGVVENEDSFTMPYMTVSKSIKSDAVILDKPLKDQLLNRIKKKVDSLAINLLLHAAEQIPHHCIDLQHGIIDKLSVSSAMSLIESHGCFTAAILTHPRTLAHIRLFNQFQDSTIRDKLISGLFGHLFTADVLCTTQMHPYKILLTSIANYLGVAQIAGTATGNIDDAFVIRKGDNEWIAECQVNFLVKNPQLVVSIHFS